jgi:hypothetical protein
MSSGIDLSRDLALDRLNRLDHGTLGRAVALGGDLVADAPRDNKQIIAGHGRVEAAKLLGSPPASCHMTCREAGIDIVFQFWRGVLVPKGTPADRVAKLSEGFGSAMNTSIETRLRKLESSHGDRRQSSRSARPPT